PRDATPRQVYADWLEDRGGPADDARAELLRLQCRWLSLRRGKPRAAPEKRAAELLALHAGLVGPLERVCLRRSVLSWDLALPAFLCAMGGGVSAAPDPLAEDSAWRGTLRQHKITIPTKM